MTFHSKSLVPCGGEIYSHIFENPTAGLSRDHFWSFSIQFDPIEYAGESWACSMTSEWVRLGIRNWRDLDGVRLAVSVGDELIESSFYMTTHDPASSTKLSLQHIKENRFRLRIEMIVDFQGFIGGDENPAMEVRAESEVEYAGLIVVPDSLFPKPSTPQLVTDLAKEFVDLSAYHPPHRDGHRFILQPKWQ